jgi:sulfhydrogenase subunit delta
MEERSAMIIPDKKMIEECRDVCNPRVGVYVLTSCYGCQLSLATVQRVLEISRLVDFKCWYMTSSDSSMHEPVDIAFVEGSVSTEKDLVELQEIRKNAEVLVAFGACAVNGGVQSWAESEKDYDDLYADVYGEGKIDHKGIQSAPIESYVKVDYRLPGCPPEEDEIVYFLSTFLFGSYPELRDYPVCAECRIQGNPCILIERGEPCLGPVITAGCRARCPTFDVPCIGCRGPVPHDNAWFDSLAQTFLSKGYSKDYIESRMKIFGAHDRTLDKRLKKIFGGKK